MVVQLHAGGLVHVIFVNDADDAQIYCVLQDLEFVSVVENAHAV